jgi:hypothetical protein
MDITVTLASCVDDSFEENDTESAAAPVAAGFFPSLVTCPADDDYYEIPLAVGDTIDVALVFGDAEGDIDLELIDPFGTLVESSTTTTDDEAVSHVATSAGIYLIHVSLFADAGPLEGNTYDMDITVTLAPCVDDAFEENDTSAAAAVVPGGLTTGLQACPTDDDWYSVFLAIGDTIAVDALFTHAEGDIDMELLDPALTEVDDSTSTSDDESVGPYVATAAGDHFIRVFLSADSGSVAGNAYALDVTLSLATCADDAFEDNDTESAASPITAGSFTSLGACPSDDDFYSIPLAAGDTIDVDLTFFTVEGDIDLQLLDRKSVV